MSLTLYPAIDLKGGNCVRLLHGEMAAATQYNDDPAAQARTFLDAGFEWLHIVDLDGAFAGKPANADAVEAIIKATKAKLAWQGAFPRYSRHSGGRRPGFCQRGSQDISRADCCRY